MGLYPRVEPYVGYGTGDYSRLICRTVYPWQDAQSGELIRGIRGMLAIPAPRTHVQASIDDMPLNTVQIGVSEVYDKVDRTRDSAANTPSPIPPDTLISWPSIVCGPASIASPTAWPTANP